MTGTKTMCITSDLKAPFAGFLFLWRVILHFQSIHFGKVDKNILFMFAAYFTFTTLDFIRLRKQSSAYKYV